MPKKTRHLQQLQSCHLPLCKELISSESNLNIKSPDHRKKLGFPSVSLLLVLLLLLFFFFFFFFYQNCNFELHQLLNFFLFHNTHFNPNARAKARV
jgi:hypothetical protein